MFAAGDLKLFCLPNGLTVFGLNENDTQSVYRDIFEDDCYRRHGIVIRDGDCILDVGANTGLFVLFLNTLGVKTRIYALEPVPAIFHALQKNVETNNHLPIHLFNFGLAKRSGQREMTFYPRFSNAST